MSGILLHQLPDILAAALYALLGAHFWRTRWSERGQRTAPTTMQSWERLAIGGALLVHAAGLKNAMFVDGALHFSFSLALSLMLWLAVLIYGMESFRSRMDGLQPLVLPFAAVCAILPPLFPTAHPLTHVNTWGFRLHFIVSMLAYSLFTLSALQAVFMDYVERRLHRRALSRSIASLPPLLTMEALLFRVIVSGFVLLTAALGSGLFFSEEIFGKALTFDHKTVFAFISWGIFALLLIGRHARGWRGRIALRWTVAGFVSLLLAYIGSRFVVEVIIGRAAG